MEILDIRRFRTPAFSAILLLSLLVSSATTGQTKESQSPGEPPTLRWLPGGESILVADRWLLGSETGNFRKLGFRIPTDPETGYAQGRLILSPSGRRLLLAKEWSFRIGDFQGLSDETVEIPAWFLKADGGSSVARDEVWNLLFWLDDQRVFAQQLHRFMAFDQQCGVYHLGNQAWNRSKYCVEGDFHELWKVESGLGGRIAAYSVGEGHPGIRLLHFDPGKGQEEIGLPELDLYPFGTAEALFLPGGAIGLSSPCDFSRKEPRPCEEPIGPWRTYVWKPGSKDLDLLFMELPEGAILDPKALKFAWPKAGKICVGTPGQKREARCYTTPSP